MRTTSETIALAHMGKAMEYFDADRLDLAHEAMARALNAGLHPTNVFDRQRVIDAELAARRDGTWLRLGEHLAVEAPLPLLRRPYLKRTIADAVLDVSETWSVRWGKPVLVTIFSSHDATLFLHSRYGYYLSRVETHKICLPPDVCGVPDLLRQAVRHEAAHAGVHTIAGDAAPRWFDEGVAVWCEEPGEFAGDRRLRLAAAGGHLPGLGAIEAALGTYEVELDSAQAHLAYAAAGSFVGWLVAQCGLEAVRGLLDALGAGADLRRASRRTLGRDLRDLERDWRKAVQAAAASH